MNARLKRSNPPSVAAPVADYTHVMVVPAGAEIVVLSGQVGLSAQGDLPPDIDGQIANAFRNVEAILRSEGLAPDALIKVNIWVTEPFDRQRYLAAWRELHGGEAPCATLAYVQALTQPRYKVEVEAWAARVPRAPSG